MKNKVIDKKNVLLSLLTVVIVVLAAYPIVNNVIEDVDIRNDDVNYIGISMSGFTPDMIELEAGVEYEFTIVNQDNALHRDGGGWHQFASDEIGFDYNVAPETTEVITLKVDEPGEYEFYCDTCCGGRESPSMQGKIIVI